MLGFSKDFHQSTTLHMGQTVSMMIKPDAAVMLVIADLAVCYPGCANKSLKLACIVNISHSLHCLSIAFNV